MGCMGSHITVENKEEDICYDKKMQLQSITVKDILDKEVALSNTLTWERKELATGAKLSIA